MGRKENNIIEHLEMAINDLNVGKNIDETLEKLVDNIVKENDKKLENIVVPVSKEVISNLNKKMEQNEELSINIDELKRSDKIINLTANIEIPNVLDQALLRRRLANVPYDDFSFSVYQIEKSDGKLYQDIKEQVYESLNHKETFEIYGVDKNNYNVDFVKLYALVDKGVETVIKEGIEEVFDSKKTELNKADLKELSNYISEKYNFEKDYSFTEILQDKKEISQKEKEKDKEEVEY